MRIRLFILASCLLALLITGRSSEAQNFWHDSLPSSGSGKVPVFMPLHKLHIGVQAGTEFSTSDGYGSGFSTFVSPTLTYPVSKRFIVSGGMSVVNTSYYGVRPWYATSESSSINGNITTTNIWVSGQYLMNDRMTITGTAYKSIDNGSSNLYHSSNFRYNPTPQGGSLKVAYKVSDFLRIEAGLGYSQGLQGHSWGYPGQGYGIGGNPFSYPQPDPFFNR